MSASVTSNNASTTAPVLCEAHSAYLIQRGVQPEIAIQAGLRSVNPEEVKQLVGCYVPHSGLAIPYEGYQPPYVRVRLNSEEGPRFLAPKGREVPVYLPPGFDGQSNSPLIVVEGPVKALALHAHGFRAVGLGGTGTTLTEGPNRRLNSSWERVPLGGRPVVVLFDSNRSTNLNVARDEARLVLALEAAGAKVRIGEIPS